MDSYAGSEPREFITFYLEKEPNQTAAESNNMSSGTGITEDAAANETLGHGVERSSDAPIPQASGQLPLVNVLPTAIEIIEEGSSQASGTQGTGGGLSPAAMTEMDTGAPGLQSPDYSPSLLNLLGTDGSSSGESIQAYLTRKLETRAEVEGEPGPSGGQANVKCSVSEPIQLSSSPNLPPETERPKLSESPVIVPVPSTGTARLPETDVPGGSAKRPRIGSSTNGDVQSPLKFGLLSSYLINADLISVQSGQEEQNDPFRSTRGASSSEVEFETDAESTSRPAGSTIAQAITAKTRNPSLDISDSGSTIGPTTMQGTTKNTGLRTSGRALIKEFFAESETFNLPKGHPVVAFTEDQISAVLKVVAEEAARTTQNAMERLISQVSELNISPGSSGGQPTDKATGLGKRYRPSICSGGYSDTSGAIQSDDDFSSIGYSFEGPETSGIAHPPQAGTVASCSRDVQTAGPSVFEAGSPGEQTLASLKAEAMKDKWTRSRNRQGRFVQSATSQRTRRKVTRSGKIMKEAYFKGMEWTRTFVSGPVDPRWNPYKFYCQICKSNVSIYGKGAREILRHHSTEKHLRKDQRWRYEHLYKVDPVTKAKIHQVRGKDGKILTPYQLELELPKFRHEVLVEIGQKLPFYEEYMSGTDYMASSSDNRARIQLSVLGRFLTHYGDLEVLKAFWNDVGVIVNHQALFTDFNWSRERLTVSLPVKPFQVP